MSDTMVAEPTVEFGVDTFRRNAGLYAKHKRLIDAIATGIAKPNDGYDSFDDAIVEITRVWTALRKQVAEGGGFTPSAELGFGSNNAAQIAAALTGDRSSVGEIRKAYAQLGK